MSAASLQGRGLGCTLGHRRLFAELDFSLPSGQWLMLTGPNGSGKSTLLRILAGLAVAQSGQVLWKGIERGRGNPLWHAAMLYQGHASGWKDPLSARANLALQASLDLGADSPQACAPALEAALERVGLQRQQRLPFARLSAGQRRRLGLARLVLVPRPLWLLDEPTTALDLDGQQLFSELLEQHLGKGGSAVIATHQRLAAVREPLTLRLGDPS
ncbi:MAG: heme ABC exporter ATP-binding protein CcmA [Quisquiliibacterium sp.]